jgi:hypothetical protein
MRAPLLTVIVLIAAAALAAPPQVSVEVEPRTCNIGDHIAVTVTVTSDPDQHIGEIHLGDLGENVAQVGGAETGAPDTARGTRRQVWRALVAPFVTGLVSLPEIKVPWTTSDGATGEARAPLGQLTVGSVIPQGITPPGPKKPHGPYELPVPRPRWPLYAVAGAIVAVVALTWLLRRMRRAPAPARPLPTRPPHEVALADLDALERSSLVAEGNFRTFFYTVTDIVRVYFEQEFRIGAPEMTSSELLAALQEASFPVPLCDQVRRWITACDLVKYASQRPRGEHCQTAITLARAIVTSAHQQHLIEGRASRVDDRPSTIDHRIEAA